MAVDAKTVYAQLLAITNHAIHLRQQPEICGALEVDHVLETYAAARSLCHEATCGEEAPVSLPDLGRIAEDRTYASGELKIILTGIEVECFKGVGALARIIALIPKEEASKS